MTLYNISKIIYIYKKTLFKKKPFYNKFALKGKLVE